MRSYYEKNRRNNNSIRMVSKKNRDIVSYRILVESERDKHLPGQYKMKDERTDIINGLKSKEVRVECSYMADNKFMIESRD